LWSEQTTKIPFFHKFTTEVCGADIIEAAVGVQWEKGFAQAAQCK